MKEYYKPAITIEEMSTSDLLGASEVNSDSVKANNKDIYYGGVDDGSNAPSSRSTVWGYEDSDLPE